MASTASNMLPLGTKAPGFSLQDTITGDMVSLDEMKSMIGTVIMFICNHCPYVKHIMKELVSLTKEYIPKGIYFIAISPNDIEKYPEDSPEKMKQAAEEFGMPFPYLYDQSQSTARDYQAACTPEFYIFDKDLLLVYRGQFDNSRPSSGIPVTGNDVRKALDCLIGGRKVPEDQRPSIGCSIKWKKS